MKIVVLDGYTENPGDLSWEGLEQLGDLTVYDRSSQDQVVERIGNAEIVLVNKVQLTKEIMAHATNLKYIGVLATGYNVVDVEAAKAKGITVTNIPTYGTDGVAQYAIALLLELCHRIGEHSTTVFAGIGPPMRIGATGIRRKWSWLAKQSGSSATVASVKKSVRSQPH